MKQFNNHSSGFTLIELIVVIAIIGILATFIVANVNSGLKKARDSERINSLKQIQTALELYYQDNGAYPVSVSSGGDWVWSIDLGTWISGLDEKYIKQMPIDPRNDGCILTPVNNTPRDGDGGDYCYALSYYSSTWCNLNGQGYILATRLEATDTTEFSQKTILDPTIGQVCATSATWSESPEESIYVLVNP